VINNLTRCSARSTRKVRSFNASVDELQKLITGLAQGRDPIAGAIPPLASAENDLTVHAPEVAEATAGRDRERPTAGAAA